MEDSFRLKYVIQIFIYYTLRAFEFKPKKKIEFGGLPDKPTGKPVKPAGKPVGTG